MKRGKIILISLLACLMLVGFVSADAKSNSFTPTMTSDTSPAGNVTSASSTYSASYPAWNGFDHVENGLADYGWASLNGAGMPQYIQITTPTAHAATNYTIFAYTADQSQPKSWTFEGSNDGGTTVTVLDARSGYTTAVWQANGIIAGGSNITFSIPNTAQFTTYRLNITASDVGYTYINIKELYISEVIVTAPAASFTTDVTTGTAPLTVTFTDSSTNTPMSWSWARKNLTATTWTQFATTQNPVQSFVAGNWSVNLTATNSGGSGTSASTWINVTAPVSALVASFMQSPNPSATGESVSFIDTSAGSPNSWYWSLTGAGYTNTTQNAAYSYPSQGVYTVSLSVTNSTGHWSNTSQTHTVSIGYGVIKYWERIA